VGLIKILGGPDPARGPDVAHPWPKLTFDEVINFFDVVFDEVISTK
jgi:hypothetical protein